jgi:hypothetical protein
MSRYCECKQPLEGESWCVCGGCDWSDPVLPCQPLTAFVAVEGKSVLNPKHKTHSEYAKAFLKHGNIRMFEGVVSAGDHQNAPMVTCPALGRDLTIRFTATRKCDIELEERLQVGDKVTYALGLKHIELWAHGVLLAEDEIAYSSSSTVLNCSWWSHGLGQPGGVVVMCVL